PAASLKRRGAPGSWPWQRNAQRETPPMRIRLATDADMPFFEELELQTTWDSLTAREQAMATPEAVRQAQRETLDLLLSRPGNAVYIAETEAGERAGMLWFGENRNPLTGDVEAWIYNISVLPAFRGQGVGTLLMAHAEALAREGGYQSLGLMVSSHNG